MDVMPKNWIFLRGLARETRHWGKFPQLFAQKFSDTHNYVLEIPGVGKKYNQSAPLDLIRYVDLLREEWNELKQDHQGDWGILAISMGAMIAMTWAKRYPNDFKEGIFINSSAGNLSSIKDRFSVDAMKMVGDLFFKEDYVQREAAILNLTTNKILITDELIKEYAEYSAEFPIKRKNFLSQMFAASRFKVPEKLRFSPIIINGAKDALASPRCSDILAKHFGVPVFRDEQSGHDLPLDNPEFILEAIEKVMKPS